MTSRQGTTQFPLLGGMNYSTPPHLIDAQQWFFARDVRTHDNRVRQNLRHRHLGTLPNGEPVLEMRALPIGYNAHCHFVAITNTLFWQLRPASVASSVPLTYKDWPAIPIVSFSGQRPAIVMYNNELWITSPTFPLHSCNGSSMYTTAPFAEHNNTAVTLDHTTDTVVLSAHNLIPGRQVVLAGTLPAELTAGVVYYVVNSGASTFQLAATLGGAAITFTSNGSGVSVSTVPTTTPVPKAKYIEVFYDHIFVGNVSFAGEKSPWRVQWSHLFDPWMWTPSAENEADHFDVTEWQSGMFGDTGLTGLKRINDALFVYTPDSILWTPYVGLPKVTHFKPVTTAHGNTAPYALASNGQTHFFYDEKVTDFFRFDPQSGPVSIGQPIRKHLLENSIPATRLLLYAQVLSDFEEIWWTLDVTPYDFWYVYNWRYNNWHIRNRYVDVENQPITCIGPTTAYRAKTVTELVGDVASQTGTAEALVETVASEGETYRLYGNAISKVYRDQKSLDLAANTVVGQTPYLETGDRIYGDPYAIKEVDAITIHANYRAGTNTRIQVALFISDFVGQAIPDTSFVCGDWTRALPEGRLTFPKQAGRVFRWRFTFLDDNTKPMDFEFFGFHEHVYGGKAER